MHRIALAVVSERGQYHRVVRLTRSKRTGLPVVVNTSLNTVEEEIYEGELAWRVSATISSVLQCDGCAHLLRLEKVWRMAISHAMIRLRAVTTDNHPMILKRKPHAGYARMSGCAYVTANSYQRASKTAKL